MKTHIRGWLAVIVCLNLIPVHAQMVGRPGGGRGGPRNGSQISEAMAKLFGENSAFSATLQNDVKMSQGQTITLPGKLSFDSGKSRFEMNMSEAQGNAMPPQAIAQMKTMGMDNMISISRPDRSVAYMIYPGLKAYAEMPTQETNASPSNAGFKVQKTELGKETVDGHPTVKNRAMVTDEQGKQHQFTMWNAADLKDFPVKIETAEEGTEVTMLFKNIKMAQPEASLFEPPSEYKKYTNMMEMMQQEMMKHMGNGAPGGMPPGHP